MNIDHLLIEVTRRCNRRCLHCLCGESQNIDISLEYIDILFSQLEKVRYVYLTGGEPLLVPHIIQHISKYTEYVEHVGIVTNGEVWNKNVQKALNSLSRFHNLKLAISMDQFHNPNPEIIKILKKKYNATPHFFENSEYRLYEEDILDQGLAITHALGYNFPKPSSIDIELTVHGYMTHYICYSYVNKDTQSICHVSDISSLF